MAYDPPSYGSSLSAARPAPLNTLATLTDVELQRRQDDAWNAIRAVRGDVTRGRVAEVLRHGIEHRAIHEHGIVLRVADTSLRVVVDLVPVASTDTATLLFSVMAESGDEIVAVEWTDAKTVAEVAADIEEAIDFQEDRPSFDLDATALFTAILQTVQVGLEARFGTSPPVDLSRGLSASPVTVTLFPIVELVTDAWAVTTAGVEALALPLLIPPESFDAAAALAAAAGATAPGLDDAVSEAYTVMPWFDLVEDV